MAASKLIRVYFLSLIPCIFIICSTLDAQGLMEIRINEIRLEEDISKWLKEKSTIQVLDNEGRKKMMIEVIPDSGKVAATHDIGWTVESDSLFVISMPVTRDSSSLRLLNEIRAFRVGLGPDGNELAFLETKLGNKLSVDTMDLLLVPFLYKASVWGFRWFVPKKTTIRIVRKE